MKRFLLASLCAQALLTACATSASGTGDPQLDAELSTLRYHEEQIVRYGKAVDSLSCLQNSSPAQDSALTQALKLQDQHENEWKAAHERANARAQGEWSRVCPLKRAPGVSCTD